MIYRLNNGRHKIEIMNILANILTNCWSHMIQNQDKKVFVKQMVIICALTVKMQNVALAVYRGAMET